MKYPLKANLRSVTLRIAGTDFAHTLSSTTGFDSYGGQRLFVNASVVSGVLKITIDQQGPEQLSPGQAATSADVTFAYARKGGQQKTETWHISSINYAGGDLLPLQATITGVVPNGDADFVVTDDPPPSGDSDTFGYVLIQLNAGQTGTPQYKIEWIGDPEIRIPDHTLFTTAEIVQPDDPPGSMSGPMGLQVP
jgi:hypothetical protein